MTDWNLPPAPEAPQDGNPRFTNTPTRKTSGVRAGFITAVVVIGIVAGVAGLVELFATAEDAIDRRRPSPTAVDEPTAIVAPTDEVVQEELEAQLRVFQEQGGEAANARLASYRAGLQSAGCEVGLGHGTDFETEGAAQAAAVAFVEQSRTVLEGNGSSFGAGAVVATTTEGTFDYYVIFVACPPVAA